MMVTFIRFAANWNFSCRISSVICPLVITLLCYVKPQGTQPSIAQEESHPCDWDLVSIKTLKYETADPGGKGLRDTSLRVDYDTESQINLSYQL